MGIIGQLINNVIMACCRTCLNNKIHLFFIVELVLQFNVFVNIHLIFSVLSFVPSSIQMHTHKIKGKQSLKVSRQ